MKYGIYYAYWERQWGGEYLPYVERVAGLGFDILEISCASLLEMSERQIDDLRHAKDNHGITLTGGYGPKASENIASDNPAVVDNALRFWNKTFKILERLDISMVGGGLYSYWPVDYSNTIDKEADLVRSIHGVKKMAAMAADYGITLGMEVLNRFEGYLLNTAAEGVEFIKAVDSPNVKLMLDTFHMNIEEDSLGDAIRTAGKYLGHFHTGECNRRVPGKGRIPWQEIGCALRDIGYNDAVVMEPFVLMGGQVGSDIKVWRDLSEGASSEQLDMNAKEALEFTKHVFEGGF
ncbi:sugar phosphate isomerase/epimerase family protein [Ruminiclostridium papyrosolvens]|uniref:D-psicose 3-epimerase n=1 Tax=Ruminiclostridium papyrosolvens C7 TaxID=1330534 RepID=U4R0X7_9FIRM|nr:sugar phosphate isomerase/epimerase family protein [Ruminiclostridium papyrosolvens]EPR10350.1 dolichol monophosphate mannose synthase [Ruminiclostridium papyrosolvens C7]